jgi:pimeloyl-ACP methyl ester carboxylesterase
VRRVTSKDGTSIAYDRQGSGPAVILVGGAFVDRSENAPLAAELAARFTVYNHDRRGRGDSGDTLPYALQREFEDLDALVTEAGGRAHLYGVSSGGALALEATAAGLAVDRLAVYEVPYDMADDGPRRQREYVEELDGLLAAGRRGDAAELFMRVAGASEEMIAGARSSPVWPGLEAIAHTLAYDAACMGNGQPPTARLAAITRPTLVATGGASPDSFVGGGGDFFGRAADAIAASIPNAQRQVIEGQTHMVDPKVLAPALERFFAG